MKILYGSDVHTEFGSLYRIPALPDPDTYDVVLLPGDLGLGMEGIKWANEYFPQDKQVYMVPGNHEYYKQNYDVLRELFEENNCSDESHVTMLDPGIAKVGDVWIIGATLWTSLELKGYNDPRFTDLFVENNIADFRLIRTLEGTWSADDHRQAFGNESAYLKSALGPLADNVACGEKVVVMTHFVPSQLCIDPIYQNSILNPYFTVDMDDLMLDYQISAWVFGHTHSAYEGEHPSGTKLLCNPMGYPGERRNLGWKTFEV
jgi:predicted phosphohydrolase